MDVNDVIADSKMETISVTDKWTDVLAAKLCWLIKTRAQSTETTVYIIDFAWNYLFLNYRTWKPILGGELDLCL